MKHIDVPKTTKYRLFRRCNVKIKELIDTVVRKEKKRIKQYPKVYYDLMIQIQDWIVKHHNVINSPITEDTLRIKDECTGQYLHLFLFVILLYY